MSDALIERLSRLICDHTGLYVREQDRQALSQKIWMRMKALRISQPQQYYQLLETKTEQSDREWKELMLLLTTCETYFFRDRGQFSLLQTQILPQLIDAKRKQVSVNGTSKPTLRLWSAGCSTGEEPYSLAILLHELLPDKEDWNILILGTDINQEVIEKAKKGIYNSWSFRMLEPHLMRYFHHQKNGWKLDEPLRQMVRFSYGNLVDDDFPNQNSPIYNMDLIICRNVFVYFNSQSIAVVLQKFYNTLNVGGYLLTGHTELYGQNLDKWQVNVSPESVIYQRRDEGAIQTRLQTARSPLQSPFVLPTSPPNKIPLSIPQKTEKIASKPLNSLPAIATSTSIKNLQKPLSEILLEEAENLFQTKAYSEAIKKSEQVLRLQPRHFEAYYLIARAYANLGKHNEADYYCKQAIAINSLSVLPYYLLAHIAEEEGEIEKAKSLLKKIIYITPSSISAYLELGSIYKKEGDITRARKMFSTAFELLKQLPPSAPVEQQSELRAGELLLYVQKMLATS